LSRMIIQLIWRLHR